jgi:hypothetical protein
MDKERNKEIIFVNENEDEVEQEDQKILDSKFGFTLSQIQHKKSKNSQILPLSLPVDSVFSNSSDKNQMDCIDINYSPHFRTITDSGKSHFTRKYYLYSLYYLYSFYYNKSLTLLN